MGYEDKKEFYCTSCGNTMMATKFASQKTIQCDGCKANKRPIDPNIVADVLSKSPKQIKEKVTTTVDGKKPAICTVCGCDMMIGKFASPKTAVCDDCGGGSSSVKKISSDDIKIDISKVNKAELPNIDEMYIIPSIIANAGLRNMECPACGHGMNIIRIMDASAQRGLIISYQCTDEKCLLLMTVSEQSRFKISPKRSHDTFNYRGDMINDLSSTIEDTRIKNSMEYMYQLLVDNNIQIDGTYIPEYITVGDYKKKNPIGIRNDEISDIIKWLKSDSFGDGRPDDGFDGSMSDMNDLIRRLERIRGIFED